MYCDFYQLTERPFNVTPDPKFLYLNARYREAIASLNYGITQRKGFITLIGEAGTGKTTLLNKILEDLDKTTKSVFIFNTNVTFEEILEYVFAEFDLPVHNGKKLYMLQRLNAFLLAELKGGGNVALLIDEAQDLEFSVLEDLRLLSNLETAKEKILQIMLSGQPELGQKLSNPVLRQLRQRIGINCRLLPLSRDEITEYIQYRLQAAGCTDLKLFSREAEDRIYHFSRGIPRLVNVVCDNALVIGYALGRKRIGAEVITEAAADLLAMEAPLAVSYQQPEALAPAVTTSNVEPQSRWRARSGMIGLVLIAMLVGLISVGRTLWYRSNPDEQVAVAPPNQQPFEVIRPGSQAPGVGVEVPFPHREDMGYAGSEERVRAEPPAPAKRVAAIGEQAELLPAAAARPAPESFGAGAPAARAMREAEVPRGGERVAAAPPEPPAQERVAAARADECEALPRAARGAPARSAEQRPAAPRLDNPPPKIAANVAPVAVAPFARREEAVPKPDDTVSQRQTARAEKEAGREDDAAEEAELPRSPRLDGVQFSQVTVRSGDSMSGIALRKYGQASPTILDLLKLANPEMRDIDMISVGQAIRLPELSEGFPVLNDGGGHYSLLVFSTPQARRATVLQNALRGRGFDARVGAGRIGSQRPVFRVVLTGFSSRDEVAGVGKQLQKLFREDTRLASLGE